MSYIDHVEEATNKIFSLGSILNLVSYIETSEDHRLDLIQIALSTNWEAFERHIQRVSYDALCLSNSLRDKSNTVAAWLSRIPGASLQEDVDVIKKKDLEYGGSWQRRGGQGAFFAACRKWDRYVQSITRYGTLKIALETDKREEGIRDDIGDLRRYLILWEAWRIANLDSRS